MSNTQDTSAPRIWLVLGDKPGDNAQVELIAEQLGLPCEIRRVLPRPEYVLGKPRFRITLDHLDPERSDALEPPWPELIITIGRRPSMAALWVREQSGNRCKIVLLGRPKRWQERFDLIIVPSQYRVPPGPQVLQLNLPLMRSREDEIELAAAAWRERLAQLPRPLTALLVGGQTKPFRFGERQALTLLNQARDAAGQGHLYISTSRRTAPGVVKALEQQLPDNASLFRWSPDAADNPYLALLGLADRFIVTGDSVSMMIEVARLGRPLAIFALPCHGPGGRLQHWLARLPRSRWFHKLGWLRYSRDLTSIHRLLYRHELAAPLQEGFSAGGKVPDDEVQAAVTRIRSMLTNQTHSNCPVPS